MTAQEFFDNLSTTDVNQMVIDKTKSMFHPWDLVRFAEAYHLAEKERIEKEMKKENTCAHPPQLTYLNNGVYHCEKCGGSWRSTIGTQTNKQNEITEIL